MNHRFPAVLIELPRWTEGFLQSYPRCIGAGEERMKLVIGLARANVEHATGGPFAAAVFNVDTGELVAPGVNLVTGLGISSAHAEIVALSLAQKITGRFDLGTAGLPPFELVASTEPCAMCLGAIPWSGVRRVVCGARDEDARGAGFDEGAKVNDWAGSLRSRGIEVVTDRCRALATDVLQQYVARGGTIYNGRSGERST